MENEEKEIFIQPNQETTIQPQKPERNSAHEEKPPRQLDGQRQTVQPPISEQTQPQHQNFFKKWGSLIVLGLALSIIVIDTTLLNVSLKTIILEFKTDIQSIQWVITAYSLLLAAFTITGGRIGDLFGRKRMFMAGAVIFAIGSFIASISTNVPVLLLGESIIEGIGAALMLPATASLLVANFKGRDRGIAFGVWGGIAGASSAIGPILGGYLTKYYSWRWGFRINVFVTILLLIGSVLVRESKDTKEKPTLDFVGVFLSALGLLFVVFGIIESSTYGWWTPKQDFILFGQPITLFGLSIVPFSIALGVVFLILFFLWEKRMELAQETPLVSLKLFLNRTFTVGVLTTGIITLGMFGLMFSMPVFLQSVLSLDPLNTGLALLPLSLTMLVVAPLSGVISNKFPIKFIVMAGLLFDALGILVLRNSLSVSMNVLDMIPGLVLFGTGMGMVMAQISNLTLSAVPVWQAGEASGINNTMRQVGASLGAAIIGAVLLTALTNNIATGINNSTVIPDIKKADFIQAISNQTSNIEFGDGANLGSQLPLSIRDEIVVISKQATVVAAKESMLYAVFFVLLAFLCSLVLPNKKKTPHNGSGHSSDT